MDKEIKSLDDSLKEVNERKERIIDNKNQIGQSGNEENKTLDDDLYKKIEIAV